MDAILDQNQDLSGTMLAELARRVELPPYVKQASLAAEGRSSEELPSVAYADSAHRRFPCHCKAATFLSNLYFLHNRSRLSPVEAAQVGQQLGKFAEYWGIQNSVQAMKEQYLAREGEQLEKLADDDFAYVWRDETGAVDRRLPLRNRAEIKAAADWLAQYRDRFVFQDRSTIAQKILHKASALGASLGDQGQLVEKMAGRGVCDPDTVLGQVKMRASSIKHASMREGVRKLAHLINTSPAALAPEQLCELAKTLDAIDRQTGIATKYGHSGFKRPEDFLFEVTYSEAEKVAGQACELSNGSIYLQDDFRKLSAQDIRDLWGDELADDVVTGFDLDPEKFAAVASTLPVPDAELLDNLLRETGTSPVKRALARQGVGFSQQQWDEMARSTEPLSR